MIGPCTEGERDRPAKATESSRGARWPLRRQAGGHFPFSRRSRVVCVWPAWPPLQDTESSGRCRWCGRRRWRSRRPAGRVRCRAGPPRHLTVGVQPRQGGRHQRIARQPLGQRPPPLERRHEEPLRTAGDARHRRVAESIPVGGVEDDRSEVRRRDQRIDAGIGGRRGGWLPPRDWRPDGVGNRLVVEVPQRAGVSPSRSRGGFDPGGPSVHSSATEYRPKAWGSEPTGAAANSTDPPGQGDGQPADKSRPSASRSGPKSSRAVIGLGRSAPGRGGVGADWMEPRRPGRAATGRARPGSRS